jgi:flavin-dependent dehydrogenase
VGDAGRHQDPWTGRGMDMAGTHATFLADAIDAWPGIAGNRGTPRSGV